MVSRHSPVSRFVLLVLTTANVTAQARAQGTRTDYARAEQLLPWNASELVIDDAIRPR